MSIAEQAAHVDRVKRSEHGVITDPFFLSPEHTIADAKALMARYRISGVPITEGTKLVGILTNRDLRFETDDSRKIGQCMTSKNLVTAKVGTTLEEAKDILAAHRIEKLPIVDDDFCLRGLITIKDIEKATKYPNSAKDAKGTPVFSATSFFIADLSSFQKSSTITIFALGHFVCKYVTSSVKSGIKVVKSLAFSLSCKVIRSNSGDKYSVSILNVCDLSVFWVSHIENLHTCLVTLP
jgi:CBS domain-containing protein